MGNIRVKRVIRQGRRNRRDYRRFNYNDSNYHKYNVSVYKSRKPKSILPNFQDETRLSLLEQIKKGLRLKKTNNPRQSRTSKTSVQTVNAAVKRQFQKLSPVLKRAARQAAVMAMDATEAAMMTEIPEAAPMYIPFAEMAKDYFSPGTRPVARQRLISPSPRRTVPNPYRLEY